MTAKNSILLIVKQNPGIDYNALLNKISTNYGSLNSARAALSRALKDLNALGMITRQNNNLFATNKGAVSLNVEMKNKLLLKLNRTIKQSRDPVSEINTIVEMLHTLIERSKNDNDLLKAAKGSAEFYISELNAVKRALDERAKQYNYVSNVFSKQIEALKEMNFTDSASKKWRQAKQIIITLAEKHPENITLECFNPGFLESIQDKFPEAKTQEKRMNISKAQLFQVLGLIEQKAKTELINVNVYFPAIKTRISYPRAEFSGAFNELKGIGLGE